jgi:hypothetical protein
VSIPVSVAEAACRAPLHVIDAAESAPVIVSAVVVNEVVVMLWSVAEVALTVVAKSVLHRARLVPSVPVPVLNTLPRMLAFPVIVALGVSKLPVRRTEVPCKSPLQETAFAVIDPLTCSVCANASPSVADAVFTTVAKMLGHRASDVPIEFVDAGMILPATVKGPFTVADSQMTECDTFNVSADMFDVAARDDVFTVPNWPTPEFTVLANTSSHLRVVDPRRWLSDGSRSLRTCILVRMSIFLIALQITVGVWISDVHVTLSASMSPDTFMVVVSRFVAYTFAMRNVVDPRSRDEPVGMMEL